MNQRQAIDAIDNLLPAINNGERPEAVLTKYAHEKNLSAAQLEKLGQVFNTIKTIDVMEKGASNGTRGKAFSVINVPEMIEGFQTEKPQAKKADAPVVEVYLEKVAHSRILPAQVRHPRWGGSPEPEADYTDHRGVSAVDRLNDENENRITAVETRRKIASMVKEAAAFIAGDRVDISTLLCDARALVDQSSVARVVEHLKQASVTFTEQEDTRVVAWDRTGFVPAFEKLAEALMISDEVRLILSDMEKKATPAGFDQEAPPTHRPAVYGRDRDQEGQQNGNRPGNKEDNQSKADQYMIGGHFRGKTPQGEKPVSEIDAILEAVRSKYMDERDGKVEQSATKQLLNSYSDAVEGTNKAMTNGLGIMDQAENLAESYISLVNPAIRARGPRIQRAGEDAKAVGNLTRLIMTDPIISQAEPERVTEIYNTLRQANPEMMADINVARSVLRESLQYPHVPLNTVQNITSMRDSALKGREAARRIRDPAAVAQPQRR